MHFPGLLPPIYIFVVRERHGSYSIASCFPSYPASETCLLAGKVLPDTLWCPNFYSRELLLGSASFFISNANGDICRYQDYEQVNEDGSKDSIFQPFTPASPSVLGQSVMRVRYQGKDGSIVDEVVFGFSYMDGKVEQKRIVDDSVEVLREVEKARASIEDRNLGF